MSNDVQHHGQPGTGLAIAPDQTAFTPAQIAALAHIGIENAPPADLEVFFHVCKRMGLDPYARQIYMIMRWETVKGPDGKVLKDEHNEARKRPKWNIQTGIDGFRATGHRAARRDNVTVGTLPVEWCDENGLWRGAWRNKWGYPVAARFTVVRDGQEFTATANFDDYVGYYNDGNPKLFGLWAQRYAGQLAKCFDADTEVLTTNGFEKFGNVTGKVLQVTTKGLEATDAAPFWQQYDGDMVTHQSTILDFSVTPHHDMVTTGGKVEAWAMYESATSSPGMSIPLLIEGTRSAAEITDETLRLAAAYVCDGSDTNGRFRVGVVKPRKVDALTAIGLHRSRSTRRMGESVSKRSGRIITPTMERHEFSYEADTVAPLVASGKKVDIDVLLSLSQRQARVFVDALLFYDGSRNKRTGVRRFYSSRQDHLSMFELAAVAAGYAVSTKKNRISDLSDRRNYYVTVTEQAPVPVRRWGKDRPGRPGLPSTRTGLSLTSNDGRGVWCVTVPSGEIVVRRNGMSMRCGNCSEAMAWRMAFPQDLSGAYVQEEMDRHDFEPDAEADVESKLKVKSLDKVRDAVKSKQRPRESNDIVQGETVKPRINDQDRHRLAARFTTDAGFEKDMATPEGRAEAIRFIVDTLADKTTGVAPDIKSTADLDEEQFAIVWQAIEERCRKVAAAPLSGEIDEQDPPEDNFGGTPAGVHR